VFEFIRKIIQKLGPRPARDTATTAPLSPQQVRSIHTQTLHYELPQLTAGCSQSVGKQRDLNEDSLLAVTTTLSGSSGGIPFGLYIVADGMGGHQYGEVASNAAVRTMGGHVMRKFFPYLFGLPAKQVDEPLQEMMLEGVVESQRVVQREAPGSGTTLTAALVVGQQVTIAHVGDSRAYIVYNDGRVEPITRDHSLVKRLEELGQLTSAEAAVHPQRNVLYRAVGQGDTLEPDILTIPFPQNGYIMICSDGLWGVISEQEIIKTVLDAPNLQRACQGLVSAANAAGGPDNISVILIQMLG
jgi:serine/threonine protein phosphatase PrpC